MKRQQRDHLSQQPRQPSSRRRLSRRTFLGGAGAAIALPWLEAMLPGVRRMARAAGDDERPRRLLFYFVPNGIHMPAWTPTADGPGFDLPPILAALEPVRSRVSIISGLGNRPAIVPVAGDHARGTGSFLTCVTPTKSDGADIFNSISVDQVAARAKGADTPYPSLQVGTTTGTNVGTCDSGYACAYSRNISWAGPSTPLPKLSSPRVLFDRLFAGADPGATLEERERRTRLRKSVLDYGRQDAKRLQTRLGSSDRAKLDEYLTSVRALENLIDSLTGGPVCEAPPRPGSDLEFPALVKAMHELMVVAMQCDQTRIISFMLGDGGSNRSFPFIDVKGAHHSISHHQNDPQNLADIEAINTWEVAQLANLLERMDSIQEVGGSMLDNSLVFWSSEIEDGNAHRHTNLPVLLAGSAGGRFHAGSHVRLAEERPLADLYIAMLEAFGVSVESFGSDGTHALPGLLTTS